MLSVQSMLDEFVFRVEIVQNYISVATMTRRKHNNLEVFAEMVEECDGVWSDVDGCFYALSVIHFDGEDHIGRSLRIIITVYECLVQVKHQRLLILVVLPSPEIQLPPLDLGVGRQLLIFQNLENPHGGTQVLHGQRIPIRYRPYQFRDIVLVVSSR